MDRGPVPSGKYRARAKRRTCAEAEVRIDGDGVVMDGDGVVVGLHVSPVAPVIDPWKPFHGPVHTGATGSRGESTPVAVSMEEGM